MSFEAGLAIAVSLIAAAFVVDWPRALCGLVVGFLGRRIPYATLAVPTIAIVVAGLGEIVYPLIGRTSEPSLYSFGIGVFSAAVSACATYTTLRNLRDRF